MNMATDKWPFCLNMTVYEVGSVIEALATKCTAAQKEADDLRYENNDLREKTNALDSRVRRIERKIEEEK